MWKKVAMFGLFAALVGAIVFVTCKQGVAKHNASQNRSDKNHAQDGKQAAPNVPPVAQQPPTPTCDEACQQGRQNLAIQGKLKQFTKVLAIVGVVQTGILIFTVAAIVGQTKANKNSARAWILVKSVANPIDRLAPDPVYPQASPGIGLTFQVCGNTPAKITAYQFLIEIRPRKKMSNPPVPDLPDIPNYGETVLPFSALPKDVMLPPREKIGLIIALRSAPNPERRMSLAEHESFLCAYGFIDYEDVFGRKGKTRVCYVYYFPRGAYIQTMNGADVDPPGFRLGGPKAYNQTT